MFSKQSQSPTPESKIWGKSTIVQNMKHTPYLFSHFSGANTLLFSAYFNVDSWNYFFFSMEEVTFYQFCKIFLLRFLRDVIYFALRIIYLNFAVTSSLPPSLPIINRTRPHSCRLVRFSHSNNQINILKKSECGTTGNVYLQMHPIK